MHSMWNKKDKIIEGYSKGELELESHLDITKVAIWLSYVTGWRWNYDDFFHGGFFNKRLYIGWRKPSRASHGTVPKLPFILAVFVAKLTWYQLTRPFNVSSFELRPSFKIDLQKLRLVVTNFTSQTYIAVIHNTNVRYYFKNY